MIIESPTTYFILLISILVLSAFVVIAYNVTLIRTPALWLRHVLSGITVGLAGLFPFYLVLKLNHATEARLPWWLPDGAPFILFGSAMLVQLGMGFYREKIKKNADKAHE